MVSYSMYSLDQPCRGISLEYPHGLQLSSHANSCGKCPCKFSLCPLSCPGSTSSNGAGEHQRKVMLLVTIMSQASRGQTFQYFMQNAKILCVFYN